MTRSGTASADVVETLARKFLDIADRQQDNGRSHRESDDVIEAFC
jgi:hypothetical protein